MTTIATGGFSNHDSSFSYFDNYLVELITVLGMVLGSLPFLLYLSVLQGKYKTVSGDSQVRWFLAVLIFVVVLLQYGCGQVTKRIWVSLFECPF